MRVPPPLSYTVQYIILKGALTCAGLLSLDWELSRPSGIIRLKSWPVWKNGSSGIEASPEMAEHGFRSQIAGTLKIDVSEHIEKRTLRFMGPGAAFAHIAMSQAIEDAGLEGKTTL